MIRQFLQAHLRNPVGILADKFATRPDKDKIHSSFSALKKHILANPGKKGLIIPFSVKDKFIIFSDQHKGAKTGSDIFALAEKNYLCALNYYNDANYTYINLGDGEELWGNSVEDVINNNEASFKLERLFVQRKAFIKVFGNHDLYWDNNPLAGLNLEKIYGQKIRIYEGIILQTNFDAIVATIFLTHGHQGDLQSDGNWFSKWFVSNVWAPFQLFLQLNLNTPSVNDHLKTLHNQFMYEWSALQESLLLITGHTHQPVFESLTQLEHLYRKLDNANPDDLPYIQSLNEQINRRISKGDRVPDFTAYKPSYFNCGCCCFNDGDITGIEIADGFIRLVKWEFEEQVASHRIVLEEILLKSLNTWDLNDSKKRL